MLQLAAQQASLLLCLYYAGFDTLSLLLCVFTTLCLYYSVSQVVLQLAAQQADLEQQSRHHTICVTSSYYIYHIIIHIKQADLEQQQQEEKEEEEEEDGVQAQEQVQGRV